MTIKMVPVFQLKCSLMRGSIRSETQVKAELDLPWREHVVRNLSRSRSADPRIGYAVVLNVESVEEFRSERNEISFTNREIHELREIRVIHGWRPQDVSSKISIGGCS
jgi:hypothetical protein